MAVNKKKYPRQVLVNLTEKQYQQLVEKSKKNGLSYSEFFRTWIEISPKNITSIIELEKKIAYEIRKLGVNINQIAKAANTGIVVLKNQEEKDLFFSYIKKFNLEKEKWVSMLGYSKNSDNT